MTDNQTAYFREVIAASSLNLRRSRELLEASCARPSRPLSGSRGRSRLVTQSMLSETALRAWQEFGTE